MNKKTLASKAVIAALCGTLVLATGAIMTGCGNGAQNGNVNENANENVAQTEVVTKSRAAETNQQFYDNAKKENVKAEIDTAKYIDANGFAKLSALIELPFANIVDVLEDAGYEFDDEAYSEGWKKKYDNGGELAALAWFNEGENSVLRGDRMTMDDEFYAGLGPIGGEKDVNLTYFLHIPYYSVEQCRNCGLDWKWLALGDQPKLTGPCLVGCVSDKDGNDVLVRIYPSESDGYASSAWVMNANHVDDYDGSLYPGGKTIDDIKSRCADYEDWEMLIG